MFTILNRLRGMDTKIPYLWVTALLIGAGFYLIDGNIFYSVIAGLLYVVGESFCWGFWLSTVAFDNIAERVKRGYVEDEAKGTGITWITAVFIDREENPFLFNTVALAIRGLYWFLPLLLLLWYREHITIGFMVLSVLVLSIGFPMAFALSNRITKYEDFDGEYVGCTWCIGEILYGLLMDFVLLGIILDHI